MHQIDEERYPQTHKKFTTLKGSSTMNIGDGKMEKREILELKELLNQY